MRKIVEAAIRKEKLVAILRGVPPTCVAQMGEALVAGGITIMEVAQSEPDAMDALRVLREAMGDRAIVGAGTVISPELGRQALAAGAQFFVTPHVVPEVCGLAREHHIAIACGALTPTEIMQARSLGSTIVKLFPASAFGPSYVKALRGPFPDLELLAVGGVGPSNVADYLKAGCVGAGIGGALTEQNWSAPDYGKVTALAAELVRSVRQ